MNMIGKPTLTIVTVKKFKHVDSQYWTYGGFGDYIKALLPWFDRIIIACHPKEGKSVPPGWYLLEHEKIEFFWLPYYEKEHECLLKLPSMFRRCREAVEKGDIINPRVPDYSGICGGFWASMTHKPMFVSLVDNWHSRVFNVETSLRGVAKLGLRLHIALYCFFEKLLCRKGLVFVQGEALVQIYSKNSMAKKCVSTSHYDSDVVAYKDTCGNKEKIKILAIGRLISVKGHKDVVKALSLLNDSQNETTFSLIIAGEGNMKKPL